MKKLIMLLAAFSLTAILTVPFNTSKVEANSEVLAVARASGTIQQGVEAGCIVLRDVCSGQTFLLLGDLGGFGVGDEVCIIGRPLDVITFCQQGQPLGVLHISGSLCPGRCPGGN